MNTMVDDAELLRRYAESGSEPAFTEFVRRHLNLVYFTAERATHGNAPLAQEVTQIVFSAAARKAHSLVTHAALAGWLHTTTRFTAARAMRRERVRRRYEQEAAVHHLTIAEPAREWERLRPVIDDALDELEARDREAILVRFFEGRPFAELGAAWRVSEDGARMRVERALDRLRGPLERRGIGSVSAALAATLATQASLAAPSGMLAAVSGTAVAAGAGSGGVATFLSFMSATKITVGTAAAVAVLATGAAFLEHNRAEAVQARLDALAREQAVLQGRLTTAERQRVAAETRASDAERDNGTLLAAVDAARIKSAAAVPNPRPAAPNRSLSPNDPLGNSLDVHFPDGVIATIGERTITVDDVRRELAPLLAKVQQEARDAEELNHRLYGLQNSVIADLLTRILYIKEFPGPTASKHIPAEYVDNEIANRLKDTFANDQAKFAAYLQTQGLTAAQFRREVEEDIIYAFMRKQQRDLDKAAKEKKAKAAPAP